MPPSIVEKYEQILAADPRSRIFVELGKALVEQGQHARAISVCQQGLEHHPSSILGRVIWGRALLEASDPKGALDQFEIAIALDPGSPYAYNLVGEALLGKGLHREALPVLARAAELQPADARVKGWLEEARRRLQNGSSGQHSEPDPERTEPERPLAVPGAPALDLDDTASFPAPFRAVEEPPKPSPAPAAAPAPRLDAPGIPVLEPSSRTAVPAAPFPADPVSFAGSGAADPGASQPPSTSSGSPAAPPILAAEPAPAPGPATSAAPPPPPAAGPPRPPPIPPAVLRDESPGSLLSMIPGGTRALRDSAAPRPVPEPAPDAAEAERLAAQYEEEVRQRLLSVPEPPPHPFRRHGRAIAAGAAVLVIAATAAVYLTVQARSAAQLAQGAADKARVGLARDTVGALREADRLLAAARRRSAADPRIASLSAQVAAVLAAEHGDARARELAASLAAADGAGDGALSARWLLADQPGERAAAEAAILSAPPSSEPLVQALAGRILIGRGEVESGRGRLEIAARAAPPLLRVLSDLGDVALAAGDPEGALSSYTAALAAQPTHPRSAVGAAEARLTHGRDLETARRDHEAIDADPGSAPPVDLRLRFELALARVLAATGDPAAGAERLGRAGAALGESAPLVEALAEVQLAARAYDRAEAAAARAVELAPSDAAAHVLLARARIGRGRYPEALAATEGVDGRAVRLQRAIARYRLGQIAEARAELERTSRDGRMPAEAAVWYAFTEVALGRPDRARAILERLPGNRSPLAAVVLGKALEAEGKPAEAEKSYRQGAERDPAAPEPHLAMGRLLLATGREKEALPELEKAVQADPGDLDGRRALGAARLAAGQPAAARAELDVVLLAKPADPAALRLVSAAWLAEGEPVEARRAAERGLAAAPRDVGLLLAGARAAQATRDAQVARALAGRALKAGARGADAAEARRLLGAEAGKRRR